MDSIIERLGHGSDNDELNNSKPIDEKEPQFTSSQQAQTSFQVHNQHPCKKLKSEEFLWILTNFLQKETVTTILGLITHFPLVSHIVNRPDALYA